MKILHRLVVVLLATFAFLPSALRAQEGRLDLSFAPLSGADAAVQKMVLQSDGKIVIVGNFTSYDGTARKGVARVNADGTLDLSFNPGNAIIIEWGQYARAIDIQGDGKVVMGGSFTNFDGNFTNRIVRLNTDGSYDPSFNATNNTPRYSGINGEVDVIKVQPDGKILVGGPFAGAGVFTSKNLVRFNTDGSADSTFVVNGGANSGTGPSSVADIAIQPDGKIVIVGNFTKYGTTTVNHIARLNVDGSLDATFNTGTGCDNQIQALTLQEGGKMVITGWFHSFNGVARWNVARLNGDGTLDASFAPNLPAVPSSRVSCNAVQQNGKVIIPANWTRLNSDGSKDTSDWHNGVYAGGGFADILVQPDGRILVGGSFVSFDGTTRNRLLRLNGKSIVGVNEPKEIASVDVFPNPSNGSFHFVSSFASTDLIVYNVMGSVVYREKANSTSIEVNLADQPTGVYMYQLTSDLQTVKTGKIIIE